MSRQSMIEKCNEVKARREEGEGGFTLIELLVVVVIIGVLVAIAIPLYLNYQQNAKEKSIKADVRNAVTAVQACYSDNANVMPASITTTATPAFAEGACAADKITVSSDTTKSFSYTLAADGKSYTISASDDGTSATAGTHFTYSSLTGNIS